MERLVVSGSTSKIETSHGRKQAVQRRSDVTRTSSHGTPRTMDQWNPAGFGTQGFLGLHVENDLEEDGNAKSHRKAQRKASGFIVIKFMSRITTCPHWLSARRMVSHQVPLKLLGIYEFLATVLETAERKLSLEEFGLVCWCWTPRYALPQFGNGCRSLEAYVA